MKVIYHCYGSSHTSVVSAAIHLGMLPSDRIPTRREILAVPHYDQTTKQEIGTPFFMGTDEYGCEVYVVGLGHHKKIFRRVIYSYLNINHISHSELILGDALAQIGIWTRVGGLLSRGLGIVAIGRPISAFGIQKTYRKFVNLTLDVKQQIQGIQSYKEPPGLSS